MAGRLGVAVASARGGRVAGQGVAHQGLLGRWVHKSNKFYWGKEEMLSCAELIELCMGAGDHTPHTTKESWIE